VIALCRKGPQFEIPHASGYYLEDPKPSYTIPAFHILVLMEFSQHFLVCYLMKSISVSQIDLHRLTRVIFADTKEAAFAGPDGLAWDSGLQV
jgi:hypothetical protein